ncbi:hypothetical protein [Halorarum halobium]|uniref:hypothetical protein n=1 Tax=Halorarum halobium TaxID=3075121 RepID=UPI0028AAF8DA|nr:hypothetical protein [Halobaculum sp. XH14]
MNEDAALVRERILAEHGDLLETVADRAEAVAAGWEEDGPTGTRGTADRDAVVPPMRATLSRAGALGRLPALLDAAVAALETSLPAEPVAAPPYVVVTATGPIVRATVPGRGRLVIEIEAFAVERDGNEPRYRRVRGDAADLLDVTFR